MSKFNLNTFRKTAFQDDAKELMQGQTRGIQNCFKEKMEEGLNAQEAWSSCHTEYAKRMKLASVVAATKQANSAQIREPLVDTNFNLLKVANGKAILEDVDSGEKMLYKLNDKASGHVVEIHGKGYKFERSFKDLL